MSSFIQPPKVKGKSSFRSTNPLHMSDSSLQLSKSRDQCSLFVFNKLCSGSGLCLPRARGAVGKPSAPLFSDAQLPVAVPCSAQHHCPIPAPGLPYPGHPWDGNTTSARPPWIKIRGLSLRLQVSESFFCLRGESPQHKQVLHGDKCCKPLNTRETHRKAFLHNSD